MSAESKGSAEIDWSNDEQVVRAAVPSAYQNEASIIVCRDPVPDAHFPNFLGNSWETARLHHPVVQAYERQHNPALAAPDWRDIAHARGNTRVTVGDVFTWPDGSKWSVVEFLGKGSYSPSGIGGTVDFACRLLSPYEDLGPQFKPYTKDGICEFCGDSVAGCIFASQPVSGALDGELPAECVAWAIEVMQGLPEYVRDMLALYRARFLMSQKAPTPSPQEPRSDAWGFSRCVECGKQISAGQTQKCEQGGLCSHRMPMALREHLERVEATLGGAPQEPLPVGVRAVFEKWSEESYPDEWHEYKESGESDGLAMLWTAWEACYDAFPESHSPSPQGPTDAEDNYVAWLRFSKRTDNANLATIRLCDSDDEGAFRVYRWPIVQQRHDLARVLKGLRDLVEYGPIYGTEATNLVLAADEILSKGPKVSPQEGGTEPKAAQITALLRSQGWEYAYNELSLEEQRIALAMLKGHQASSGGEFRALVERAVADRIDDEWLVKARTSLARVTQGKDGKA